MLVQDTAGPTLGVPARSGPRAGPRDRPSQPGRWQRCSASGSGGHAPRAPRLGPGPPHPAARPWVGRRATSNDQPWPRSQPLSSPCSRSRRSAAEMTSETVATRSRPVRSGWPAARAAMTRCRWLSVNDGATTRPGAQAPGDRARAGQPLHVAAVAGGHDAPARHRQRLHPAEAGRAAQGGDAPADDEVHRLVATQAWAPASNAARATSIQARAEAQGQRHARLGAAERAGQHRARGLP